MIEGSPDPPLVARRRWPTFSSAVMWRDLAIVSLFNGLVLLLYLVSPHEISQVAIPIVVILGLAAALIGIALRGQGWPITRQDWPALAISATGALLILADLTTVVNLVIFHQAPTSLTVADRFRLLIYPIGLFVILVLPGRLPSRIVLARIFLDVLTIMNLLITFGWFFVTGPMLNVETVSPLTAVLSNVIPGLDLFLFLSLLFIVERMRELRLRPILFTLGSAYLILTITDSVYATQFFHDAYVPGGILTVGWSLGMMVAFVAARASRSIPPNSSGQPSASDLTHHWPVWQRALPYVVSPPIVALFMLTWDPSAPTQQVIGVAIGLAIQIVVVLVRQIVFEVESQALYQEVVQGAAQMEKLALIDSLTGLPNPRALTDRLATELSRAKRYNHPIAIFFCDLDRFKEVNDTFGHAAGDAALREFARVIRDTIRDLDMFGRWGGEEFLAILPETGPAQAALVAERIRDTVAKHLFSLPTLQITCSIGVASFPQDATTQDELVLRSDRAMYTAKSLGRNQVRLASDPVISVIDKSTHSLAPTAKADLEGTVAALVLVVDSRDSYTAQHSRQVASLSRNLGVALGVSRDELADLVVGAELHDIGKIAIPDAILRKQGPLTDPELKLMRIHPVVGAAVVGLIPRLKSVARLVRSHHERWDGNGYPDRLTGTSIPLGSRIIAVTDAFNAMVTDRPYCPACLPNVALKEIERCSGTQFDPDVVAQFITIVLSDTGGIVPV